MISLVDDDADIYVADTLVGDMWAELQEVARGRRIISSAQALVTTDRGSYCLFVETFENEATASALGAQIYRHLRALGCAVRISKVSRERERLEALEVAKRQKPAIVVPVRLLPPGNAINGAGRIAEGERNWIKQVQYYIEDAGTTGWFRPCLVVWGGSGVGKTMCLSQLGVEYPHFSSHYLSFAECDWDGDEFERAVAKITLLARCAPVNKVLLCLDDFDVLTRDQKHKVVELLQGIECRRILIINDLFDKTNIELRYPPRPKKVMPNDTVYFSHTRAHGVHHASLASYIGETYPHAFGQNKQRALELVQMADGDARAALLNAHLEQLEVDDDCKQQLDANARREYRQSAAPHYALLAAAEHDDLEQRFVDLDFEEIEALSDLCYGNSVRAFPRRDEYDEPDLLEMAALAEVHSFANTYMQACRNELFEGDDAHNTDKHIAFNVGVALPCNTVGRVAPRNARTGAFEQSEMIDKPQFAKTGTALHFEARERAGKYGRALTALDAVGRIGFKDASVHLSVIDGATAAQTNVNRTECGPRYQEYVPVLLGPLHGDPLLLLEQLNTKGVQQPRELHEAVVRCAAAGLDGVDFAHMCLAELSDRRTLGAKTKLPKAADIAKQMKRARIETTRRAELVEGPAWKATKQEQKRAAAAAVTSPRKRPKKADAAAVANNRKLTDMLAPVKK